MQDYRNLIDIINQNVKRNGNQEITGDLMNSILKLIINFAVDVNQGFNGILKPNTPAKDITGFWVATQGNYPNFNTIINDNQIGFVYYDNQQGRYVTEKIDLVDLDAIKDYVDTRLINANIGFGGEITSLNEQPSVEGMYIPTINGVYPNFGNLSYDNEVDGLTLFVYKNNEFSKINVPLNIQLSNIVEYGSSKAVTSIAVEKFAVKKINNIAELRNTKGEYENQIIELLGYYETSEYSLKYKWTSTQGIDDGGSIINSGSGSWFAVFNNELIDLKYYGVKNDEDCYNALNTVLTKFGKVKGDKEYLLNTPLTLDANNLDLEFDLSLKTTIPINKAVLTINNPRSVKGIINCDLTESTSFFLDINNASEVDIKSNSINSKQTEGSSKYNYFIRINESYKAIVRGGNFENMNPVENGSVGDTDGSARAILFTKVNNGEIYDNVFNEIRGYEDGEAVHIQTSVNNNKWEDSNIKIHNNTFNNIYKRGVKLQASSCEVYNNEFNSSSYSEDTLNITRSAVSSYGNNNKIYNNTGNLKFSVSVFDLSTDNTVINNQIYSNSITLNSELLKNTLITRPAYVLIDKGNDILISNNIFKGSGCINLTNKLENSNILSNQIDGGFMVSSNSATSNTNIKGNFLNVKGTGANTFPYDTLQIANPTNVTIIGNTLINSIVGLRVYGVMGSGFKYYMNEFILNQSGFSNLNITAVTSGTIITIPDNLYDKSKVLDFNNEGFYQTSSSFNLNTLNGSNGYGLVSVNCINVPPYPELTVNLWRVETQRIFSSGDLLQTATSFRKNDVAVCTRIYNSSTSTWGAWFLLNKKVNQVDSTASTIEGLRNDFNSLLSVLR